MLKRGNSFLQRARREKGECHPSEWGPIKGGKKGKDPDWREGRRSRLEKRDGGLIERERTEPKE